ncbi:uncharacterized protein A1O9_03348 [Exophiala aquamarina CBS 119918]|uniref:Uncharacterized protein n=1 Tax=Exophiala aquamarina CBS 119918 TaxID=1182545 RepID=A0A072PR53_9EURO|nr:uncharacterized protein A1O9_03348 [Exophiala aquamarina CBS 119918]KEF61778.1 hypothetical protein A1O9_03348 [Exophiala aquamarina CBS 119918]
MDAYVEDQDVLFDELFSHLRKVETGGVILDEDLLKRAERSLDTSTPGPTLWQLLSTGEALLQVLQQDPRPLTCLLERDISLIPFDELKQSVTANKLEEGLDSPSVPIQLLCIAYLRKAADTPSGASFIAASSSLVKTLLTLWLGSENTEVAERALEAIEGLLAVDSKDSVTVISAGERLGEAQGQGLLWRRIFHDIDVYKILFEWTSLTTSKRDVNTKKGLQLVTISQARLFDFIARAAPLDWAALTTSSLPNVENKYMTRGDDQPFGGILRYAASSMIDSNDLLMEVLRQDFFVKLLGVVEDNNLQNVSPRLLEAIQQGAGVESTRETQDVAMHL